MTVDSVFVGDAHSEILRLNRQDLNVLWRQPADGLDPFLESQGLVILFGGLRYRAIDQQGSQIWELKTSRVAGLIPWRDRLVLLGDDLQLVVPSTGQLTGEAIRLPLILGGGGAVLCNDVLVLTNVGGGPLLAYDLSARRVAWKRHVLGEIRANHALAAEHVSALLWDGGDVFVLCVKDGAFGCSLSDGSIRWMVPVPDGQSTASNGRMWILSDGLNREPSRFVCVDTRTGQIIYDVTHAADGLFQPWRGVMLGTDYIAYSTRLNLLAVFRVTDGSLAWSAKYQSEIYEPAFADERLLVPAADGRLLVFR